MKRYPSRRQGWVTYYVGRYNRTQREGAATMALFYTLLILALESEDSQ